MILKVNFNTDVIKESLKSLDPEKSMGCDQVNTRILQKCAMICAFPLSVNETYLNCGAEQMLVPSLKKVLRLKKQNTGRYH